MLSFNLPQIWIYPTPWSFAKATTGAQKEGLPCPKGGLKSAGPCQKRTGGATPPSTKTVDFRKDSRPPRGHIRRDACVAVLRVGSAAGILSKYRRHGCGSRRFAGATSPSEVTVGKPLERDLLAIGVEKPRAGRARNSAPDRGHGHPCQLRS